jgi:pullulanase
LVRKHLEFLDAPKEVVAFRLKNYAGRDDWRDIIVVLNATRKMQCVTIPKGSYSIVCRDGVIEEQGLGSVCGSEISVGAQSAIILHN